MSLKADKKTKREQLRAHMAAITEHMTAIKKLGDDIIAEEYVKDFEECFDELEDARQFTFGDKEENGEMVAG